jgi:hypothetical protein
MCCAAGCHRDQGIAAATGHHESPWISGRQPWVGHTSFLLRFTVCTVANSPSRTQVKDIVGREKSKVGLEAGADD